MTPERAADEAPSARQFRIRDLLLVTFGLSVILALGRVVGGDVGPAEVLLLAASVASILVAGVFLRQRTIWCGFLAAASMATAIVVPAPLLMRCAVGALLAAYLLFAALPVLAAHPAFPRWPWMAAAAGCQLLAAVTTPPEPASMVGLAALLSWLLAVASLAWRYRRLRRAARSR